MGFLEPQRGRILVNGVDLREIDEAQWRARLGWMPQRPTLFWGSVADNIRLGAPEASAEAVAAAATTAQASDFIAALPAGLHTRLGDGGQGLSGGRSSAWRWRGCSCNQADVLVLDEPTAALDRETARRVVQALRRECADSALLFITHDLEAASLADRILVLDHGRIVEAGAPADLAARGGPSARLLALLGEAA